MYKILIVEDDRTIARVLASHLEKWEYEVRCTEDFHNVMAEFLAFDPQLVMLDIALPFFNGFHWCLGDPQSFPGAGYISVVPGR